MELASLIKKQTILLAKDIKLAQKKADLFPRRLAAEYFPFLFNLTY